MLFVGCCVLVVVRGLLSCCSLCVARCSLFAVCRVWFDTRCVVFVVRCLLFVVCCWLFAVRC